MKDLEKWMPKKEEGYSFYEEGNYIVIVTPYEIPAAGEKIFLKVSVKDEGYFGNTYHLELCGRIREYITWCKEKFALEAAMLSMERTRYFKPIKHDREFNPSLTFFEPYHLYYNISKLCNFIVTAIGISYSDIEESDI